MSGDYYGETNALSPEMRDKFHGSGTMVVVDWTDKRLASVDRLRLISDPGYPVWDVSYCWGTLRDGTIARVDLPFSQLPKKWRPALIAHAKRDRVYAKGLGIFESVSTLI